MRSLTDREVSRTILRKTSLPLILRALYVGKNICASISEIQYLGVFAGMAAAADFNPFR